MWLQRTVLSLFILFGVMITLASCGELPVDNSLHYEWQRVLNLRFGDGPEEIGIRPEQTPLYEPTYHFAVDNLSNIWLDDFPNDRLIKVSPKGKPLAMVEYSSLGITHAGAGFVLDLATDGENNLYISRISTIHKVDPQGQLIQTFEVLTDAQRERIELKDVYPRAKYFSTVYVDANMYVYTVPGLLEEEDTPTVVKFTPEGQLAGKISLDQGEPEASFAVTTDGYLFLSSFTVLIPTVQIGVFSPDEVQVSMFPVALHDRPHLPVNVNFLGTDKWHNVYICDFDYENRQSWIKIYSLEGALLGQIRNACSPDTGYVNPEGEIYMTTGQQIYKMVPSDASILQGP